MVKNKKATMEECYQYVLVAPRMDWENHLGSMLKNTEVDVNDMAIVFFSKLARWNDEKLYNKIDNAFKEWMLELKDEAKKMYDDMNAEEKQSVKEIAQQLTKIRKKEE